MAYEQELYGSSAIVWDLRSLILNLYRAERPSFRYIRTCAWIRPIMLNLLINSFCYQPLAEPRGRLISAHGVLGVLQVIKSLKSPCFPASSKTQVANFC